MSDRLPTLVTGSSPHDTFQKLLGCLTEQTWGNVISFLSSCLCQVQSPILKKLHSCIGESGVNHIKDCTISEYKTHDFVSTSFYYEKEFFGHPFMIWETIACSFGTTFSSITPCLCPVRTVQKPFHEMNPSNEPQPATFENNTSRVFNVLWNVDLACDLIFAKYYYIGKSLSIETGKISTSHDSLTKV